MDVYEVSARIEEVRKWEDSLGKSKDRVEHIGGHSKLRERSLRLVSLIQVRDPSRTAVDTHQVGFWCCLEPRMKDVTSHTTVSLETSTCLTGPHPRFHVQGIIV